MRKEKENWRKEEEGDMILVMVGILRCNKKSGKR